MQLLKFYHFNQISGALPTDAMFKRKAAFPSRSTPPSLPSCSPKKLSSKQLDSPRLVAPICDISATTTLRESEDAALSSPREMCFTRVAPESNLLLDLDGTIESGNGNHEADSSENNNNNNKTSRIDQQHRFQSVPSPRDALTTSPRVGSAPSPSMAERLVAQRRIISGSPVITTSSPSPGK